MSPEQRAASRAWAWPKDSLCHRPEKPELCARALGLPCEEWPSPNGPLAPVGHFLAPAKTIPKTVTSTLSRASAVGSVEEAAPAIFYLPATAQPLEDSDEVLVSIGTRKSTTGPLQQHLLPSSLRLGPRS